MNRNQIFIVLGAVLLLSILYFAFDKLPPKQRDLEKSRLLNIEATGLTNLVNDAMPQLDAEQKTIIEAIKMDIEKSGADTLKKIERLKSMAGTWYEFGFPSISGTYAEEIANLEKTDISWSMTGTTFALCVKNAKDEKEKEFCSKRAIKAFENAISISPDNVDARINLAICYVDKPLQDDPMKGILMLRDLSTKYPQNVAVLNQLAKLAVQTNQFDKALSRLESALLIEPENQTTICLIATVYKQLGNEVKANEFGAKCVN
jgi:tetratricopeptide (TPR) repeat protein